MCLSFIYSMSRPMALAFYPPPHEPRPCCIAAQTFVNSGGLPFCRNGLHELAAPSRHSPMITHWLVVSYTTFSPLPPTKRRRSFSSAFTYCHQ